MSTLAPLVMAAFAALNCLLPCGLCTVYWEVLSPASWNDFFRSRASTSKYGAVASSGRITPMLPLPLAAIGLRADIAEKLLLTWFSESCGPDELPLPDEPEDELPLQLQQAARTRAALPAHAARRAALLVSARNGPPPERAG